MCWSYIPTRWLSTTGRLHSARFQNSIPDSCFLFEGYSRYDFTTQISKDYFNCAVTLPCNGFNISAVTFIEILMSKETGTKSLASIRSGNKVETCGHQEVKGLDVSGVLSNHGSHLALSFMTEKTSKVSYTTDCIFRGLDGSENSIVFFRSRTSKIVACKDNNEILKAKCLSLFSYNQSKYCLSNFAVSNISAAIANCDLIGGYLAEVNDVNEYRTIQNEFNKAGVDIMLIGGSDEAVEGKWVYQHSGTPVTFFDWSTGQPDNAGNNEDCLEMRKGFLSRMNDIPCFNSVHGDSNFLCEIKDD